MLQDVSEDEMPDSVKPIKADQDLTVRLSYKAQPAFPCLNVAPGRVSQQAVFHMEDAAYTANRGMRQISFHSHARRVRCGRRISSADTPCIFSHCIFTLRANHVSNYI